MFDLQENRFDPEQLLEFEDGRVVFSEGDDSREMYVIQSGEVVITKGQGDRALVLGTLKRGDLFGEMSLLESLPRSATARAKGKTRLMVLQPGGFLLKIRRDPTLAFEMLQQLSKRIRVTNERLHRAIELGRTSPESVTAILQNAEFGGDSAK